MNINDIIKKIKNIINKDYEMITEHAQWLKNIVETDDFNNKLTDLLSTKGDVSIDGAIRKVVDEITYEQLMFCVSKDIHMIIKTLVLLIKNIKEINENLDKIMEPKNGQKDAKSNKENPKSGRDAKKSGATKRKAS